MPKPFVDLLLTLSVTHPPWWGLRDLGRFIFRIQASQVALVGMNPLANEGDIIDTDSIPGCERSPGGGHGNPFQYSCLENPHGQKSLAGCSPWGLKRVRHD